MHPEKRNCQRNDIFLIIHFRQIHNSYEYALGIARNYSDDGFSMESHNFEYKPGQILECTIKRPGIDSSVSMMGEIVWKKDGWYDAVMGMKFLHMDGVTLKTFQEFTGHRQKEREPALPENSVFSTAPVKHSLTMIPDNGTSEKTEQQEGPVERQRKTSMPSTKARRSYFRLYVFLALCTVIIFSIAARNRKDVLPLPYLPVQKADSQQPEQNTVAAAASDAVTSPFENAPKLMPAENIPDKALSYEADIPNDIIRDEITFDVNSADIASKFNPVMNKVADILLGNPGLIVKLEGHTDSAGSDIYNMDLSIRRAAAVRSELISRGILSSRIKIVCFGHSSPAASNDVESGRKKNRRVEISIPLSQS